MLTINIKERDFFDDEREEFFTVEGRTLRLKHSLVSLSKWEAINKKPFLVIKPAKTLQEIISYIKCMTIDQNVNPNVYTILTKEDISKVNAYIEDSMSATTFSKRERRTINREIVTAEIIYYWMIALQIPVEFQKWHLNRLLTLVNVCNIKNQPTKKGRPSKQTLQQRRLLNKQRQNDLNTSG